MLAVAKYASNNYGSDTPPPRTYSDGDHERQIIANIEQELLADLDNYQMERLHNVLVRFIQDDSRPEEETNDSIASRFYSAKSIEGLSANTIKFYRYTIKHMLDTVGKHIKRITTDDIRLYIADYPKRNNASKVTINNIRRNLSSFFGWLENENIIIKSPMRRIKNIKVGQVVKETYSDEMLEKMRKECKTLRDAAILNFLASTGLRVGELVSLNIADIDFQNREFTVLGKGNKERRAYFDIRAKVALMDYLNSRDDDNPALFVAAQKPHERLNIGSIEATMRNMGKRLGIGRIHPHKFRRTLATIAIDRGMPIEQVQQLLGHSKIDTTMGYAMVNQSNVKNSHRKYIG